MSLGYDWETPHNRSKWSFEVAGIRAARLLIVFCIGAVVLGVITTPLLLNESEHDMASSRQVGVDMMSTGSIIRTPDFPSASW